MKLILILFVCSHTIISTTFKKASTQFFLLEIMLFFFFARYHEHLLSKIVAKIHQAFHVYQCQGYPKNMDST